MKTIILTLTCLLACGLAFEGEGGRTHHHCSPKKWQGNFHTIAAMDHCVQKMNFGTITADFEHGRMKVDYSKYKTEDESHVNGTVLYYFDQGFGFHLNRTGGTCKSFKVPKFPQPHIPKNAKFHGQSLIGSQSIHTWEIDMKKGTSGGAKVLASITQGTCFPVSVAYMNKGGDDKESVFYMQSYWNVVPSVVPFTFEVPHLCKQHLLFDKPLIHTLEDVSEEDFHVFGPMAVYDV